MSLSHVRRSLLHRHHGRGSPLKRGLSALKYVMRCLLHWRLQAAWLGFLYGSARMSAALSHDPRLSERPLHVYISRRLSLARRYAIIESHYRHLHAHWPVALVDRIYGEGEATLGRITLKNGQCATLQLRRPSGRGREGELALYLLDIEGRALSSMVFTLADDGKSILIGCVQGAAAGLGLEAVRDFTRQACGLRPKNLLLSMLYALARHGDNARLFGIGSRAHPFARNKGKIKADYDGFWAECHAMPAADGFHALPSAEPVRDESLVESKHRSAFRKREALRREACQLLVTAVHATPTVAVSLSAAA